MGFLDGLLDNDTEVYQTKAWDISLIKNGLRCTHKSGQVDAEYFEADELRGIRAFEKFGPMSPLDVFSRLMEKTPLTKGFVYKFWDIVIKDKKGFIIRPRLTDSNQDIDHYNPLVLEERYKTTQSLEMIDMQDFLIYIEEAEDYERTD